MVRLASAHDHAAYPVVHEDLEQFVHRVANGDRITDMAAEWAGPPAQLRPGARPWVENPR